MHAVKLKSYLNKHDLQLSRMQSRQIFTPYATHASICAPAVKYWRACKKMFLGLVSCGLKMVYIAESGLKVKTQDSEMHHNVVRRGVGLM